MNRNFSHCVAGICFGIIIGFVGTKYILKNDNGIKWNTKKTECALNKSAQEMVSQLFPDFTLLDIYKDARIVDIIRNPGAITVYKREGTGHAVEVGGFRFSNQKSILMADDAAAVSACFRSVNSIEVGAGYPCTFDPKFLIRFESKSKLDVVDFLCGRDCYLVDWYFNFHQVDGSVSRLKMNHLGISILEAVFESASLGSAKTQDTK